jgi:hypothetical protein
MPILYFLGIKPKLEDGVQWSHHRCPICPDRPNLRAVIRNGEVAEHGCPLCGKDFLCEVDKQGVHFFPPGTIVI